MQSNQTTFEIPSYMSKEIALMFKPMWFRFSIMAKIQTQNFWFQPQHVKSLKWLLLLLQQEKCWSNWK